MKDKHSKEDVLVKNIAFPYMGETLNSPNVEGRNRESY